MQSVITAVLFACAAVLAVQGFRLPGAQRMGYMLVAAAFAMWAVSSALPAALAGTAFGFAGVAVLLRGHRRDRSKTATDKVR